MNILKILVVFYILGASSAWALSTECQAELRACSKVCSVVPGTGSRECRKICVDQYRVCRAEDQKTSGLLQGRNARAQKEAARPTTVSANQPKRYELDLRSLINPAEGVELRDMGLITRHGSTPPQPLKAVRESRGLWEVHRGGGWGPGWETVPGLGAAPLHLACGYQRRIDRGKLRGITSINRSVKFWYSERPFLVGLPPDSPSGQGRNVIKALIELQVADVALEQCPATWGEALTAAFGEEVWSRQELHTQAAARQTETVAKPDAGAPAVALALAPEVVAAAPSVSPQAAAVTTQAAPSRPLTAIQSCDKLAAHPDDPEAFAAGVPDNQLNTGEVIAVCEAAVQSDKTAPRLVFQLARGYLKAERVEDAVEQLVTAGKRGHGGALAYLADIHLDGVPGIEPDPALAHSLYTRALASGFEPAKAVLAQFEDYTDQAAAADKEEKKLLAQGKTGSGSQRVSMNYNNPEIINSLLKGELDAVPNNEQWVKRYLLEVATTISESCNAHFTSADVEYLKTIVLVRSVDTSPMGSMAAGIGLLQDLANASKNLGAQMEEYARRERDAQNNTNEVMKEGITDGLILTSKLRCGSAQLSGFSRQLSAFIQDEGAPRLSSETLFKECQRYNNKSGSQHGKDFCFCITTQLTTGTMTRAERKGLATNFQTASQKILDNHQEEYKKCF